MNATKRKFNALIQGMGSRSSTPADPNQNDVSPNRYTASPRPSSPSIANQPSPSASSMTTAEDLLQKRRRLQALTEKGSAATQTIKSIGGTTKVSNIVLKKWTANNGNLKEVPQPAAKYTPSDRAELLKRLATFQEITDWTPKPDKVNEIEWAKRGWVCQGKERVRCTLCNKELLVKLNKREVDGKEVAIVVSSDVEEALKDKYAELVVTAHQEDCLWRRRGCEDSLLRLSLTNARVSYETLRQRYDELCERKSFLPYEFNLRLPEDFDLNAIMAQLPDDFFTNPQPKTDLQHPNKVALNLALMGWQGLSNPRIGSVPNSASCHTCLRRLGLWMFKSKEVNEDNEILVPAPMDHLDPAREHRFFCPWKNPQTQRMSTARAGSITEAPAWKVLVQVIKNDAYLRGALDERPKTKGRSGRDKDGNAAPPSTPKRPTTPGDRGIASMDAPSTVATDDGGEDDEQAQSVKDKERWARLRRVKSLFESKGSRRLRRTLSRPSTAKSTASTAETSEAAGQASAS